MKRILFALLAVLLLNLFASAQINVGPKLFVKGQETDDFEPGALDKLKKTTTYFVYGKNEKDELENWKLALNTAWSITPIEFMSFEDFMKLKSHSGMSFLMKHMTAKVKVVTEGNQTKVSKYFYGYLSLSIIDKNNKSHHFCRIELYPTKPTVQTGVDLSNNYTNIMNFTYNEAQFHNWYPGLMRGPIRQINHYLKDGKSLNFYKAIETKNELSRLRTHTLYIPDYAFLYHGFIYKNREYVDVEAVLKKYPYEVEVLEGRKLSNLILKSNEDLYVMLYVKSMGDRFVTIWNCQTDELLFKEFKPLKYHMKKKDFKNLGRAVSSAPKLLY
jgi:hypothetical protein